MANGIGRLRTIGIAAQPTFGQAAASASYVLPLLNSPTISVTDQKINNDAVLGSAYMTNEVESGNRFSEVPLEFKVDEDHVPLLFKQRFSISSVTASGETAVYEHTLTFQNTTNSWYTIFMQDDQRQDYVVRDVLLNNLSWTFDGEFVRVSATAQGAAPTATAVTNTVVQPKEFVGRMVGFEYNDDGSAVTATRALTVSAEMTFGTNGEDTRFNLGNRDLGTHLLTQDEYQFTVTRNQEDRTNYDDYMANQAKQFEIVVENTDRFIAGSTNNTRPYINFSIPYAKLVEYSDDSNIDNLVQETLTLRALDKVGETNAPMQIVVRNAVASY